MIEPKQFFDQLDGWSSAWPKVHGQACGSGYIRAECADFQVNERLGFEPDGEGQHVFLQVQKTDLNTLDVVHALAKFTGIAQKNIGYSGLKDKRAVTTQFFSIDLADLARANSVGANSASTANAALHLDLPAESSAIDWTQFEQALAGVKVLSVTKHRKKLRRGAHTANDFVIRVTDIDNVGMSHEASHEIWHEIWHEKRSAIECRLQTIQRSGVPNYFGPQRFGRGGRNIVSVQQLMADPKKRLRREQKSIILSAARSWWFNQQLALQIADKSWGLNVAKQQNARALLADAESTHQPESDQSFSWPMLPLFSELEPADQVSLDQLKSYQLKLDQLKQDVTGDGARSNDAHSHGLPDVFEQLLAWLVKQRLSPQRRSTVLLPDALECEWSQEESQTVATQGRLNSNAADVPNDLQSHHLTLRFSLRKGEFATALLRELFVVKSH